MEFGVAVSVINERPTMRLELARLTCSSLSVDAAADAAVAAETAEAAVVDVDVTPWTEAGQDPDRLACELAALLLALLRPPPPATLNG